MGFSRILSLGNQLDVDIADGIRLLDQDANTRVISIYIDGAVDVLLRVGQLANDFHCISELDINPLIVSGQGEGCWAVDGRIAIDQMPV